MKILNENGITYLWKKISLQDYPNNETLVVILNAIDETKADKSDLENVQNQLNNTETWTFTLSDGSIITKSVVVK